jgi:hypothetical protein
MKRFVIAACTDNMRVNKDGKRYLPSLRENFFALKFIQNA